MVVLSMMNPQAASMAKTTLHRLVAQPITKSYMPLSRAACMRPRQLAYTPHLAGIASPRQFSAGNIRSFSIFSSKRSKDAGEAKSAKKEEDTTVKVLTEPAWPHPVYTHKQMMDIVCLPWPNTSGLNLS